MKKEPQNIPNSAIQIGPFLQNISLKLTTDFAYKLFVTPTKHKLPEREEKMESEAACKYIKISKIRKKIRVLEYGKSEKKILLVHGWSGRSTQLSNIAEALLKEGYMTISFDAPAHGKSDGKKAHMAMFIECIMELEKIYGKFEVAIGHSLGGMAVMNSVKRGLQTEKAVIIGSGDVLSDIFEGFVKLLGLKPIIAKKLITKFENKHGKLSDYNIHEVAKTINIPIFVIHDTHDQEVPSTCATHIHKHLPNGKLLLTEKLGHRRILRDKKVIEQIIEFIA
ncbi:MAG: alpha/beta hydrolase [Flavobacteriaceae bacterium]